MFADETTLPTLAPGSGKVKTAYLWAYARDDWPFGGTAPPMVAYRFEDSRSGDCVARHLDGYGGILQVDGYAAYNRLAKADSTATPMTLAGCWSHVRRKFYDLHADGSSPFATRTVELIAPLWGIEGIVRGQNPAERELARRDPHNNFRNLLGRLADVDGAGAKPRWNSGWISSSKGSYQAITVRQLEPSNRRINGSGALSIRAKSDRMLRFTRSAHAY